MTGLRRHGGRLLSLAAIFAILGLVLHTPLQVAAQDEDISFKDLDGYQRGVSRTYMGDITALMGGMGTPGAETPDMSNLGLFMMLGMVGEFDNSDNAGAAFDKLLSSVTESSAEEMGTEIKEIDVDKIGDKTKAFTGTMSEEGMEGALTLIAVQKGEFIYVGMGVSIGGDPTEDVTSFVKDMTDNKPGDGDGTFKDDGTSTGGLWDVFPNDADYLKGLTPMSDEDLAESGV